jgi:hypothetical protein
LPERSAEQLLAFHDRERRITRTASSDKLVLHAEACVKGANAWLRQEKTGRLARPNRGLAEALRVVEDDALYIAARVRMALESRYRRQLGEPARFNGDPSEQANVALVLSRRSVTAWQTIAKATRTPEPASLARQFAALATLVAAEFSDAARSDRAKPTTAPGPLSPPRTASLDARLSAMEKTVDGLVRAMERLRRRGARSSRQ